jgi:hypothetical protein
VSGRPDDPLWVFIEGIEKWLKVVAYLWCASWLYDFICVLPHDIGNQVMDAILQKLGIKK